MRSCLLIIPAVILGIPDFSHSQDDVRQASGQECSVPPLFEIFEPKPPVCCNPEPPLCCNPKPKIERAPAQPEGAFVAPVQRGEVSGESNSLGIRFGRLRFPEMSIGLPTIQLPSFVKYRRDAEMLTESATAPFIPRPQTEFRISPERAPAPKTKPDPESAPAPQYSCPQPSSCIGSTDQSSYDIQLSQRSQQVEALALQVAQLQQLLQQAVGGQAQSTATKQSKPVQTSSISTDPLWMTPEDIRDRKQQREMHAMRSEIGGLKDSLQTLVDLQTRQYEMQSKLMQQSVARQQQPKKHAADVVIIPAAAQVERQDSIATEFGQRPAARRASQPPASRPIRKSSSRQQPAAARHNNVSTPRAQSTRTSTSRATQQPKTRAASQAKSQRTNRKPRLLEQLRNLPSKLPSWTKRASR